MRIAIALFAALWAAAPAPAQERPVYVIPVTGTIEQGLAPFVVRSVREAEQANARAVVLTLDTPGGRVDAAERIADALRDTRLPVYAWVDRRAFSAGALLALATDSIFMRPGGVIGAATPVDGTTGQKLPEKYVSAMRAEFRALAEQHGIDPRLAEGMVDENVEIEGVKPKGQLLTLSTDEALRLGVARGVHPDREAFLAALGLGGAPVVTTTVTWSEGLVRLLSNPIISSLLLTLGMIGLVMELKTPQFGLAGITGMTCIALFFGSHWIIGLAGWFEVILILAGLAAMLVEIFIIPGFGVVGIAGLAALGAGFVLSMLGSYPTRADLWQALIGVGVGLVVFVSLLIAFIRHLPASRRLAGLLHQGSQAAADGFVSAPARADLLGKQGVAASELRPVGAAEFAGERVDVTTEGEWLPAGTPVTVVKAEPMRVVVRKVGQVTS
jgi:membrane-bound serine protease (ClpP class)